MACDGEIPLFGVRALDAAPGLADVGAQDEAAGWGGDGRGGSGGGGGYDGGEAGEECEEGCWGEHWGGKDLFGVSKDSGSQTMFERRVFDFPNRSRMTFLIYRSTHAAHLQVQ